MSFMTLRYGVAGPLPLGVGGAMGETWRDGINREIISLLLYSEKLPTFHLPSIKLLFDF